jgi:hypothetical protein
MLVFIAQSQFVSDFYKFNLTQSELPWHWSMNRNEVELSEANLFCFLRVGKFPIALKGGHRASIC